jgi:hypothetical protein
MNWGYKIAITFTLFAAGIMWMVFKSANQPFDLVTTDYYAKELKYQDQIDAAKRNGKLSAPVSIELQNNQLIIYFPKEFDGKKITGEVLVYCPADEKKDIKKQFESVSSTVLIPIPAVSKGKYSLQLNWQLDTVQYYFEKDYFL